MDKEKILQVLKDSYENKDKICKERVKKFIEETTPFITNLDKDLVYYRILYYRLALVLDLDLDIKGIEEPNISQAIFTGGVLESITRLEKLYDRYKNSEVSFDRLSRSIERNEDISSFALDTKHKNILKALEKYISVMEKYNECKAGR